MKWVSHRKHRVGIQLWWDMEEAYARAEQSCSESSWRILVCSNPESPSGGVMDPKAPGFSFSHRAGMVLGCCAGSSQAARLAQSQGRVPLWDCRALKGVTVITADLFSTCQSRALLKLEVFSTWSTIRELKISLKHLNFCCSVPNQGEMKTKHLSDLMNKLRTENLDAQPGLHHSTSSLTAICKGICNLSLRCL